MDAYGYYRIEINSGSGRDRLRKSGGQKMGTRRERLDRGLAIDFGTGGVFSRVEQWHGLRRELGFGCHQRRHLVGGVCVELRVVINQSPLANEHHG